MRALSVLLCLTIGFSLGCDKASEPAPVAPMTSATAGLAASAAPTVVRRAFHYDFVLTITEGATKTNSRFSLELAEGKGGAVNLGKNVMLSSNARSDMGSRLKANLTMEGDTPKLDVATEISGPDAVTKIFRASPKGAAATPLGKATTVIDATENGRHIELSATATAAADLGEDAKAAGGTALDITGTHTGGTEPKTVPLSLTINGDQPAVANKTESRPLQVVDGGVGAPRQDTGTRVKVKGAEAHANGMAFDYEIEVSDVEPANPALRIRKITASGRANVPYDKPTSLLSAEEDAQQYGISVTLHRSK